MENIPPAELQSMVDDVDRLIAIADDHEKFVLAALLCAVRDHLQPEWSASV